MNLSSSGNGQGVYNFGEFTLDISDRRLIGGRCPVHLAPKTYDVLVALVRRAGRLVTKQELFEDVWAGVFVNEGILTVHVAAIRKALGETKRSRAYIETVSGAGYRFVGSVESSEPVGSLTTGSSMRHDRETRL